MKHSQTWEVPAWNLDSPHISTHKVTGQTSDSIQLHSHSFYEIIFCESGNIQYLIGDQRYQIRPGDMILLPPGTSHRPFFPQKNDTAYSRIVLRIHPDFFKTFVSLSPSDIISRLRAHEHFVLRTEGSPYRYLEDYFQHGLREVSEKAPLWELSLSANTVSLLVHISRALINVPRVLPLKNREEIDHIISFVENHYAQKISLEDTAHRFNISSSTLSKLFFNKLGISFYHFVTQRRLINSRQKIEQGHSMEEVALSCGFSDYSAFYRAFKKEYGISPREYKNMD